MVSFVGLNDTLADPSSLEPMMSARRSNSQTNPPEGPDHPSGAECVLQTADCGLRIAEVAFFLAALEMSESSEMSEMCRNGVRRRRCVQDGALVAS